MSLGPGQLGSPATLPCPPRCAGTEKPPRDGDPLGTRARTCTASVAYVSHVLDRARVPPRTLRSTPLIDLVNTMDPELAAAAFGMDAESVMIYLADHVDPGGIPEPTPR